MPAVTVVGRGRGIVASKLVERLSERGFRVLAVEHAPRGLTLREFPQGLLADGAEKTISMSVGLMETVERVGEEVGFEDLAEMWPEAVVGVGFEDSSLPKIVVAHNPDDLEIEGLREPLMAFVVERGMVGEVSKRWPKGEVFTFEQLDELAGFVLSHVVGEVVGSLPGKKCRVCGYPSCGAFGDALMEGRARMGDCVAFSGDVELWVNGRRVILSDFPMKIFRSVATALARTVVNGEEVKTLKLQINWELEGK
ncbi:MAG: (Fe-S)-binding protein [Candidatus Geothermarchaeales archaeon]